MTAGPGEAALGLEGGIPALVPPSRRLAPADVSSTSTPEASISDYLDPSSLIVSTVDSGPRVGIVTRRVTSRGLLAKAQVVDPRLHVEGRPPI